MTRRTLVAAALALPIAGKAQTRYPDKPVRIILPFSAGTSGDVMMRGIAQRLSEMHGQQFFVDNRDGGLGIPATQAAARAEPDGYTLFFTGINHVTNVGLRSKLPYDTAADFAAVSLVGIVQTALVTSKASGIDSYQELVKRAKANPGQLTFGSAGIGTGGHLSMEMFMRATGISLKHIPYRGATAALNDVVSGQIDVLFTGIAGAQPLIQQGRLDALLVSGSKKAPAAPNAPTLAELGFSDYDVQTWFGLLAPAGTPADEVKRLSTDIATILREPATIERFNTISVTPVGSTAQEFDRLLKKDLERWPKLIRELGLTT
jgi:tripartite-type tricarboxylate transporter receptor subunit TctC